MMKSRTRLALAAVLWVGVAAPSQGEVYRWQDSEGNVHFGDRPPAGAAPEALDLKTAPQASSPTTERLERQQRYLDVTDQERRREAAERERAAREQARRKHNCRAARARLDRARNAGFLYEETPEGRAVLDDAQREAYTDSLREAVARWCG